MGYVAFMGAVELGLVYALLALGLFVSYRILNIADLTVDGSFTTGICVSGVLTVNGMPFWGIFLGFISGTMAGFVTGFLQTKLKIQSILAGILTATSLYSVNLMIMGQKPNIAFLKNSTIFTMAKENFGENGELIVLVCIICVVSVFLALFFKTKLGLSIRATGDNIYMVQASSINADLMKILGLCLGNGLTALSGAVLAQYQGFSDISSGVSIVVVGLASLIVGETIFGKKTVNRNIIAVVLGAIVYRIILALALNSNVSTSNLKLLSAIIVVLAISYPTIKESYLHWRKKVNSKNV